MLQWTHAVAGAAAAGLLVILLIVFVWKWCFFRERREFDRTQTNVENQQVSPYHQLDLESRNARPSPHLFRPWVSPKPMFNWADHPSLVTDAVENGWSRFGFTGYMSSASTRSPLLGICSVGDDRREDEVEIIWEICDESSDFMQKVRINPGLRRFNLSHASLAASSVLRTALPLPGPYLGNTSFPQEAFFEVKILYSYDEDSVNGKGKDGEKTWLIQQDSNGKAKSESLVHVSSISKLEELKSGSKGGGGKGEVVSLSIGLSSGGSLPLKLPGSYPGSIGFNSNGSVYLDGIKLVFESEKDKWGGAETVIGCGFDPRKKKVFFTVDTELMHEVHCKTEEFGYPLYPTLAANTDTTALVNFGQSAFKYAPANARRTPNPCFTTGANTPAAASLGYEDSKELFSMGRIDSKWLDRSATRDSHSAASTIQGKDFDDESEADFIEIALGSSGRTPKTLS